MMVRLRKLWQNICIAQLYALILVVLLQVVTRYLSQFTLFYWVPLLPWTEEMSRFLFIAMVNLGMVLVMAEDGFVRVEFVSEALSKSNNKHTSKKFSYYFLILRCILLFFFILFGIGAYYFVMIGFRSTSPSLRIPFGIIFAFVLAMSLFCSLEIITSIVSTSRKTNS